MKSAMCLAGLLLIALGGCKPAGSADAEYEKLYYDYRALVTEAIKGNHEADLSRITDDYGKKVGRDIFSVRISKLDSSGKWSVLLDKKESTNGTTPPIMLPNIHWASSDRVHVYRGEGYILCESNRVNGTYQDNVHIRMAVKAVTANDPGGSVKAAVEDAFVTYMDDSARNEADSTKMIDARPEHVGKLKEMLADPHKSASWVKAVLALGYVGNNESVDALFAFVQIRPDAEQARARFAALLEVPNALGVAAQKNEKAYQILKQGTRADVWAPYSEGYAVAKNDLCASMVRGSLNGLGASGRRDARTLVDKMRREAPEEYLRSYCGSILQAVFHLDWIDKYGIDAFRKELLSPVHAVRWNEWKKGNKPLVDWAFGLMSAEKK
jgi:hypothetical protein